MEEELRALRERAAAAAVPRRARRNLAEKRALESLQDAELLDDLIRRHSIETGEMEARQGAELTEISGGQEALRT